VLTNLVSLARKRSEKLEPALMMLSDLMRYMLYESDEKKVLLAKEIEYLESYIELQKLRFEHSITIKKNVTVADKEMQHLIEPMLLIPFAENAFKHGLNADEPLIEINLSVDNGRLEFDVRNKFSEGEEESKDESSGIGLENVKSRLMLLYPKTHHLAIKKENNFFHVHLMLQLK
ncbi:MAG TPA: histidine kinase, partial [Parafilimonas sp.]